MVLKAKQPGFPDGEERPGEISAKGDAGGEGAASTMGMARSLFIGESISLIETARNLRSDSFDMIDHRERSLAIWTFKGDLNEFDARISRRAVGHRHSDRISRAALWPGTADTAPPGWVDAPHW